MTSRLEIEEYDFDVITTDLLTKCIHTLSNLGLSAAPNATGNRVP